MFEAGSELPPEPFPKADRKAAQPRPPVQTVKLTRANTLPAWARAAMPAPSPSLKAESGKKPDELEELNQLDELEAPSRHVWRVVDLVSEVRGHIEQAYADLWVRGEISNLRAAPSGHLYFTLKDGDAQLPAVLFRRQAQLLRFKPEDGLEVLLRGRVSVYEQRGQMQLIAEYLEPVGAGSLQLAFEQLKKRLEAEGLFAMDRKQPLPAYPRCVGIVTSPTGAVIRDFLNVANRRHAALDVLLYPALVQGEQAAAEIAAGVAYFNRERNVDVIVVARGGGSLEDLAPFNSERVARAIAASTLPVVSAVGHETDFTIADFVADLRAPTPSAAAELITAAQHRVEEHVAALRERLGRATRYTLALGGQRLAGASIDASFARLRNHLGRREQRVDELRFRLERAGIAGLRTASDRAGRAAASLLRQDATQRLRAMRERLSSLTMRLERGLTEAFAAGTRRHAGVALGLLRYDPAQALKRAGAGRSDLEARLVRAAIVRLRAAASRQSAAARTLESLSPLAVLGRGYALVFAADGSVITRADATAAGAVIEVRLGTGTLGATVTRTDN